MANQRHIATCRQRLAGHPVMSGEAAHGQVIAEDNTGETQPLAQDCLQKAR